MKKLIVLATLTLAATACGGISEGHVVGKAYHPEYFFPTFIITSCGNGCTSVIPIQQYVPECYGVYLRGDDGEGEVCVPPDIYNSAQSGQYLRTQA